MGAFGIGSLQVVGGGALVGAGLRSFTGGSFTGSSAVFAVSSFTDNRSASNPAVLAFLLHYFLG